MFRLALYPIGGSYVWVVVAALVLAALLAIGPPRDRLTRPRRIGLMLLRVAVIVMVILAMLRPTIVYTEETKQSATLVVLVDRSRSMSVPDAVGNKPRWEALTTTLEETEEALAELAEDFEVKPYLFDSQLAPTEFDEGRIDLPEAPEGSQTAIGSALNDVLRQEAGKRLLGIVLLSDGAQRAYAPRDLPPQTAAARLKHLGYALHALPFGQGRGLGQARDVAVAELLAPQTVFVKNELTVSGEIRLDGYANRDVPVRLMFESEPGKMDEVARETLKPTAGTQTMSVRLDYVPEVPGEYKVSLRVDEQPGELVTTNNELSTFVNVLKGGLNVLYLEGALRVETKFLRRALDASPDVNVDYLRIDAQQPKTRPQDLAERFRPGAYEVVIIGDLDATAFRQEELEQLSESVARGTGLMMLGGFHSFGAGGYADTPLADVLPIRMNRFERQNFDEPIRSDLHWPGPLKMQPTRLGLQHFALRLASTDDRNRTAWAELPPLEGANRFEQLKPGAVALAEADEDKPLLVAQVFGNGRVIAFAGDSTWHWWMQGHETRHKRFWRQLVLWLARKDQSLEGSVWIKLPRRRFAQGELVTFQVGARSPEGEPVVEADFQAEVVLPDGTTDSLRLVRKDETTQGSFRGTAAPGDYTIRLTAAKDGQELGRTQARFLVSQQDLELDNAAADPGMLESLAAMTGGRTPAPEQLAELIREIAQGTDELIVRRETKRTFWDNWPFFLAFVGLMGVEWYLRKRWGLV